MAPSKVCVFPTETNKRCRISRHFLSKTLQTRQLDDVKRRPRWPDTQFGNQEFRNKRA